MKKVDKLNTKGEMLMFTVLDGLIPYEHVNHGYYSFLRTPRGGKMQLDRFYPALSLAFEYQGTPHDTFFPEIHGTYEEFLYYKECDELKKKLCRKHGITLVEVKYNHIISDESMKRDIEKANNKLHYKIFGNKTEK